MAGEMKWLVLAAALATTGCGEGSPELVAMKIELNALKQEMEYLRLQTEDLDPRVRNAEQMALQVLDEREAPLLLDCVEHRPGIVLTRLAPITAVCEGVVRTADGYRLRLKLGNPTSARFDGVRLTLYAGEGAAHGRSDTRMNFEARAALPPGEWTTLEVDLAGVPERATSDLALRAQIYTIALARG